MAQDPDRLEREIDQIRHDLDDVVDELNTRLATTRRNLAPKHIVETHPVALSLVATGMASALAAFGMLVSMARHARHRRRVVIYF